MANISGFFKNVGSEMRKVSWPKRKELTRYTIIVLATVAVMAVFFAVFLNCSVGTWSYKFVACKYLKIARLSQRTGFFICLRKGGKDV